MSLAGDDIWHKFDLSSTADKMELKMEADDVLESASQTALFQTKGQKKSVVRDSLVPDIVDIFTDSTTLDVDINMDGGIDMDFDSFLDDILSLEERPLLQDCMWSAQVSEESTTYGGGDHLLLEQRTAKPRHDSLPTSSVNLGLGAKDLSCFDTPLSSETSDLDETSSDLETEVEVGADRLRCSDTSSRSSPKDFTFSDHCYTASSSQTHTPFPYSSYAPSPTRTSGSLTPAESSEEDEVKSTFRVPSFPLHRFKRASAPHTPAKPSQAKFKFQLKFKSRDPVPSSRYGVV